MVHHPFVSILMPAYNAEKTLAKCLESILKQNYSDFEVVIINDGSKDRTLEIAEKFSKKEQRINVFSQENKGVSAARNKALEIAKGEFFCWIDSDDFVSENHLSDLVDGIDAKLGDSVMVMQNLNFIPSNQDLEVQFIDSIITKKEYKKLFSDFNIENYGYNCGKLFNLTIIRENNLSFDPQITISEDLIFMLQYLKYADYVHIIPGKTYHYITKPYTLQDYKFASYESDKNLFLKHIEVINELKICCSLEEAEIKIARQNEADILMRALYANYRLNNKWKSKSERIQNIKELLFANFLYIREFYVPASFKEKLSKQILLKKKIGWFDLYRTIIRNSQKRRLRWIMM